jgi:dGTPase
MKYFIAYAELVLTSIYQALAPLSKPKNLGKELDVIEQAYPSLGGSFRYWLQKYSNFEIENRKKTKFANELIYNITVPAEMKRAIITYISSMTDQFALKLFGELTRF